MKKGLLDQKGQHGTGLRGSGKGEHAPQDHESHLLNAPPIEG
jgi:hypothetical protein